MFDGTSTSNGAGKRELVENDAQLHCSKLTTQLESRSVRVAAVETLLSVLD